MKDKKEKEYLMKVKYKAIYKEIREQIERGKYKIGDQIPDENTICQQFGCSRMTVKKAYDILVNEGYIYRRQGQGSFVLSNFMGQRELEIQGQKLTGFSRGTNGEGKAKILHFNLIFATEEIAQALNIRPNDPVYDILRVQYLDDKPYVIEQTYMNPSITPGITQEVLEGSIYHYLEDTLGLKIGSSKKTVSAAISNDLDRQILYLSEIEPVLVIDQIAYLNNGIPFEYSKSRHHYGLFHFSVYALRHS